MINKVNITSLNFSFFNIDMPKKKKIKLCKKPNILRRRERTTKIEYPIQKKKKKKKKNLKPKRWDSTRNKCKIKKVET
jgi:hypothetical protein